MITPTVQIIYRDNDNLIELDALKNTSTNTFVNTATVQVTLKDSAGQNVSGETWPLVMGYVSGSNGTYRATLEDTLPIVPSASYKAVIDAVGESITARWEIPAVGAVRKA